MGFWLKAKWRLFLQLIGLYISDEWLLLQSINKEYGDDVGELLLVGAILLELEFGMRKSSVPKIREKVERVQNEILTDKVC